MVYLEGKAFQTHNVEQTLVSLLHSNFLLVIVIGYSVKMKDCELLCNGNHPAFSFTIFSVINMGLQLLANCQRFGKQENMQNVKLQNN